MAASCFRLNLVIHRKSNQLTSHKVRNATQIYIQQGNKICFQLIQKHPRGSDYHSYREVYLNAKRFREVRQTVHEVDDNVKHQ